MLKQIKTRSKKEIVIRIVYFLIWFAFNLFLCIRHEPFRDEAQSWQLATSLNVGELFSFMWQEGNSWLWHLILMPFARFGLPYVCAKYLALAISSIGMLLFALKAPFKTMFVCGAFFLPFMNYYPSAFARPYCLMILGMVLVGLTWSARKNHPWLLGLAVGIFASSHTIMLGAAFIIGLVVIYEGMCERRVQLSFIISAVSAVIVCYAHQWSQVTRICARFGISVYWLIAAIFVCLAMIIILFNRKTKKTTTFISIESCRRFWWGITVLATLSVAGLATGLTALTNTASMTLRYLLCVVPAFLCCVWIAKVSLNEKFPDALLISEKHRKGIIAGITAVMCVLTPLVSYQITEDMTSIYSNATETAQVIDSLPEDTLIVSTHQGLSTSVVANLKSNQIIVVPGNTIQQYTDWSNVHEDTDPSVWLAYLKDAIGNRDEMYLLIGGISEFFDIEVWMQEVVRQNKGNVYYTFDDETIDKEESFWLFRIDADALDVSFR